VGGWHVAEITKANEEVLRVMNLYDEVVNQADVASLLVTSDTSDQQPRMFFPSTDYLPLLSH